MNASQSGTMGKVRGVVSEIHDALRPVVTEIGGRAPRASTMARDLGIDQTLTARLLRALRPPDITSVIHEVPSPEGLRIFLAAASRAGLSESCSERAHKAVREFERIISEFPGGRAGLNAAFAGLSPATRDHTEGAAKQSIYKSMSILLGFCCDVSLATFIIRRSTDAPNFCDTAYVLGKYNVQRLRPSHAITMFGRTLLAGSPNDPDSTVGRTLDGRFTEDVGDYLLTNYCSRPLPRMDIVNTTTAVLNVLPEGVPAVNEPVSLVSAQLVRRGSNLASGAHYPCFEGFTPRMPSKILVMDALVEEGLFGGPPLLGTTLHSLNGIPVAPGNPAFHLDEVSLQAPVQQLPRGLHQISTPDIPDYSAMIGDAFASLGWDRSGFVGYRTVVRYPVPVVNLSYWFPKHVAGA
ncbi:MAG: hypothetical protein JSR77_13575 [Planctomycetes bacterium]|nr:hypothetical protein [Planctomycetota bacterium]